MVKRVGWMVCVSVALLLGVACEEKKVDEAPKEAAVEASAATETPSEKKTAEAGEFGMIGVDSLAKMSADTVAIFDANGDKTREKHGVIPNAQLLTDYSGYDTAKLPADKEKALVFYCANEMCKASHVAAKRATAAGHANVSVLPDGIMGWKEAGQNTVQPAGLKQL